MTIYKKIKIKQLIEDQTDHRIKLKNKSKKLKKIKQKKEHQKETEILSKHNYF